MADRQRIAAAKLLLDRGMRFTITDAPLSLKLLRLNKITIHHLRGGTIAEISTIIDRDGLDNVRTAKDANVNMPSIALVVSMAILNHKKRIKYLSERLAKILLWKIPAQTLIDLFYVIASMNKLSDFMNITEYFCHQATMMMSPKNTGQTNQKGS